MVSFGSLALVFAGPCPPDHPKPGTTIYETHTFTATGAGGWKRTGGPCILGRGLSVWQRAVTYSVTVKIKYVSECYKSCWDRFWAWDGCCKVVTQQAGAPYVKVKTQTVISLSCSPPPAALPPPFDEIYVSGSNDRVDPPVVPGTAQYTALALEFPDLPGGEILFQQILSPLSEGYSNGSTNFDYLADTLAGICEPPPEIDTYVTDLHAISSGFASAAAEFAAGTPTEATFQSLATYFDTFRNHLDALNIPKYSVATPYLTQCANFLNDAAYQASLGLDSDEEQTIFLQDAQSFGNSLRAFGDNVKEPIVGGVWVPIDKFGLLAPYIGLASTITVAAVASAAYIKHVKRRKKKQ